MDQYIITIDIGTTSTKAFAFLPDGFVLASFQKTYPTSFAHLAAEQNPEEIFEAVNECVSHILSQVIGAKLVAISFSSAMHSFMAVDADGNPTTPLIIWADNRSEHQASKLKAIPLGDKIYKLGGTPIHPMAPICKLLWLREEERDIFKKAAKFISIKEYILFKLTGEFAVDYSIASATGLFDTKELQWNAEALDFCGITATQLSTPYPPEQAFSLNAATTKVFDVDVPLIIGASDGCLANLGSNATELGSMAITIGTSGAVRMASSNFKTDALQRTFCYYLSVDMFIVGGATNNGAVLLNWFSEYIQNNTQTAEAFVNDCFSVPSSEGLIFLPYLNGERAPVYDPNARGAYVGIAIHHTQAHFKRAMLEGICFAIKSIVNSVEAVVMPSTNISVSGGFIQSDKWVQLLCDILDKPLYIDVNADASSVGAAILGFKALGIERQFLKKADTAFYPDKNKTTYFEKKYEVFASLYSALKSEFVKMKAL